MGRGSPILAALCSIALGACGDVDGRRAGGQSAPPPVQTTDAGRPAPPAITRSSSSPPAEQSEPGPVPAAADCGRAGALDVDVAHGDVTCEEAREAVAGYELDGPKVQEVGGFVCEAGEAAVRPLVLTCVSAAGEIVASASGG